MWGKGEAWAEREKSTMLKQAGPIGGRKERKKGKEREGEDQARPMGSGNWARQGRRKRAKKRGKENERHGWARLLLGRWTGLVLVLLS